jgi:hypothetical protein
MQSDKTDIIILRGAPGSGKSQVAKSLSKFFPKGVKLEVDSIRQMVISVDWKNQQEHINMLEVSTRLVHNFLKIGFAPVIMVDTFSGNKLNKCLHNLYQMDDELSIKIFGLFTTEDELRRRIDFRSNGEFKDLRICKKLNDEVPKLKYDGEIQIDTTILSPLQTAHIIYKRLG